MAEKRVYKMVHAEANRRAPATATAAARDVDIRYRECL